MTGDKERSNEEHEAQPFQATFTAVEAILRELSGAAAGAEISRDSIIVGSAGYEGETLLGGGDGFGRFSVQIAMKLGCIPYPLEEVEQLSVKQFCEMYLRDSYPPAPATPLRPEQYEFGSKVQAVGTAGDPSELPICFSLGCARSGTTLFRVMLNAHAGIWAPGELHLAQFSTMADRARGIKPVLRRMPIPEIAERFGDSIDSTSSRFGRWEDDAVPVEEVYRELFDADPDRLIVDKTPSYSDSPEILEAIGSQFTNAKYIYLVRNPVDVIRSLVKIQLYKGAIEGFPPGMNPYQVSEAIWTANNANITKFLDGVPNDRQERVYYEDLVAEPEKTMRRLCEFLGLPYESRMADPYRENSGPIATAAGDMYVHSFKRIENREVQPAFYPLGAKCKDLASTLGY